jgi:hypothetical protein
MKLLSVDMDGDVDILAGGTGSSTFNTGSSQLMWCENEGGSDPAFVAHVLLGGASVILFDVLVGTDSVLIIVAEETETSWISNFRYQLKWFRIVPGLSTVYSSDHLLTRGPVIWDLWQLVISSAIDVDLDPTAFEFFTATSRGVTWHRSDESSPTGLTNSSVMMGEVRVMGVADVDGEGKSLFVSAGPQQLGCQDSRAPQSWHKQPNIELEWRSLFAGNGLIDVVATLPRAGALFSLVTRVVLALNLGGGNFQTKVLFSTSIFSVHLLE